MDIRCVLFLIITNIILIKSQEHCNSVYLCCEKTEFECTEYCPPFIECPNNTWEQESKATEAPIEPTEAPVDSTEAPIEPTEAPIEFEPTKAQKMIGVGVCRLGHKLDGNGRCRKVLRK